MRAVLVVMFAIFAAAGTARADGDVGVVVTGDVVMQPAVATHIEHWLKTHGHKIVVSPLSTDATNTIFNCLVLDDEKCARGVVEARSKANSLVFVRVEVPKKGAKDITFNLYWFVKGHEAIGERRVCEKCTEDSWHGIADSMMSALAGSSQSQLGHLKIDSEPQGMIVLLDNAQIGVTPLERDVPTGHHRIELTHAGRSVGARQVDVTAGDSEDITIRAKLGGGEGGGGGGGGSKTVPLILLGTGVAALGTGGILLYYGSLGGSDQKFIYPDSTPYGIGALALGLGAAVGGAILLLQSGGSKSAPVASVGPNGGYVGWVVQF
jgi:PEGA domain-containing protein